MYVISKPIYNITPFTLLDYPNKSACIFWYAGCNMRCLYCYNPEIVLGKGNITFSEAISFLKTRQGLLDAVVFSGGECLIHKNILDQIKKVKELGFLVKIDTNGSNPNILKELIDSKLIDYVALDFKAAESDFQQITKSDLFLQFEKSFEILQESKVEFEIRTTYHSKLIPDGKLNEMIEYLVAKNYLGNYFIQSFKNNVTTLGDLPFSDEFQNKNWASSLQFNIVSRN
jgi:pyruvate formate lyase activating enzyme